MSNPLRHQLATIAVTAAVSIAVSVTSTLAASWASLSDKVSRGEAVTIARTYSPYVVEQKAIERELQLLRERQAAADARLDNADARTLAFQEAMRERMRDIEQKFARIDAKLEIILQKLEAQP